MKQPINIKTEILYGLITKPFISEQEFVANSFRIRLSELRNDLAPIEIKSQWQDFVNFYGHKSRFKKHFISEEDIPEAKKVYKSLVNQKEVLT